jgi:hypothetical protein
VSSLIAFERMTSAKAMEIIIIIIVFSFYVYDAKITVARANLRHRILKVNISPPPPQKKMTCAISSRDFLKLKELGWYVMTVWECQLKPAVREQTLNEIMYLLDKTDLERIERKADKIHHRQYSIQDEGVPMAADPQVKYGK